VGLKVSCLNGQNGLGDSCSFADLQVHRWDGDTCPSTSGCDAFCTGMDYTGSYMSSGTCSCKYGSASFVTPTCTAASSPSTSPSSPSTSPSSPSTSTSPSDGTIDRVSVNVGDVLQMGFGPTQLTATSSTKSISTKFEMLAITGLGMQTDMSFAFQTPNCEFGSVDLKVDFNAICSLSGLFIPVCQAMSALLNSADVAITVQSENGNTLTVDLLNILPATISSALDTVSADFNIVLTLDTMYSNGATVTLDVHPKFKPSLVIFMTLYDFDETFNILDTISDQLGENSPDGIVSCRSSRLQGKKCILIGDDATQCIRSASISTRIGSSLLLVITIFHLI